MRGSHKRRWRFPLGVAGRPLIGAALLLIAAVLAAGFAAAQEPGNGQIIDIDDSRFPEVRVIATVLDGNGRPVQGLTAASFTAQETGAPASVIAVETVLDQEIGVAVVLTIDTSGSMTGQAIVQAKAAASAFVRSLQASDQTAIVSFSSEVRVQDPLGLTRDTALAALDSLSAFGNTALFNAVVESANLARGATLPRRAIVLLSDGRDFGGASTVTGDQAISAAAQAGIPIYTIGLGVDIDREFLQELARRTGGSFFEAPTPSSIPAIYQQLSQLLRSQYVLRIRSTAVPDVAERSLRLTVNTPRGPLTLTSNYTTRRTLAVPTPLPAGALPPPSSEGANNLPLYLFLAAIAAIGAGWAGRSYYMGRRSRLIEAGLQSMASRASSELALAPAPAVVVASRAVSLLVEGPSFSRRFRVGEEPATIGSAPSSALCLPDDSGAVAPEHARVWSREGRLMFHQIAAEKRSLIGGRRISWISLDAGDEIDIGPYKMRVEEGQE